ncbi:penicillin-binding protein 2 [Marinimicrobium agarilyticum]|uniref:penicillin-binding protein 2 n=1 Tax=Marinimicrobium agarilyticum TaxID=306546 RepID=UPI0004150F71|nr:penicillin-binding protein 2 [Marinimicrobium agarilyticum]
MSEDQRFKDHHREARITSSRLVITSVIMAALVALLVFRYYTLQVVHHEDYATRSDRNRVHVQPVPPTRGLIYDRDGELLADNRPSYTLSVIRERVDDMEETVRLLRTLVDIPQSDLEKFYDQLQQWRRPFEAIPVRYGLTEEEIARLAVNEYRLEGVEINAQLVRHYPKGKLFAHVLGYVGRISQADLAQFDEDQHKRYSGTHSIGKSGLEKQYESLLLGDVGSQNVETNARGRVLRVLDRTDPKPGEDLYLHLDADIQRVAVEALGEYRGAVVAMDVKTGGVLAAVSTPSFDPNLFVTGISFRDYRRLNQSLDLPLFNRFLQGQYPPGSTVKPVMGLAGLHYDVVDTSYSVKDPGFYRLPGDDRLYRDWKRYGHGKQVALEQAIEESCDVYFYDLGHRMGIDHIHQFGIKFGLGSRTGVDIPSERNGLWPSREWKRNNRGLPWFPGDNLNVAIGQGFALTTPMQLAQMTTTLANRGHRLTPQMVSRVGNEPVATVEEEELDVAPDDWDFVLSAMEGVMHGERGTARRAAYGADYHMAGKTGTAQVVAIPQGEEYDSEALLERQRDHALFVGFAPVDDPQIAVAVVVENGESGSGVAAPVARKVFDAYMKDRDAVEEGGSP